MMTFYNCSDFPFNFNLIVNLKSDDLSGEDKLMSGTDNVTFVMEDPASITRWETGWTTCLLGKLQTGSSGIMITGGGDYLGLSTQS